MNYSNTMKTSRTLLLVILAFTALIICEQFGSLEAKPQNPWGDKFNTHDPNGVLKTNSDPFDTPFFKNRNPNGFGTSNNNDIFGGSGTNFETSSNTFSRSDSFDRDFERSRKTAETMFWVVAGIIIFSFIAFAVGIVACICIPTCYLARYRGRRTAGQVYQQPGGVTVPLTGYPTQQVGSGPYPGQQQIPGQYPYPNTYQPNQNFPGSNYPNTPYPAATNGGNQPQPGFIQQYVPQGPNEKAQYPNAPYPTN